MVGAGAVGRGDPQHPAGSGRAPAAMAYGDVKAAWEDYLAHDNNGRGFVLIGHSQGSGHLIQLIKDDIDNNSAVRSRLVSAILLGGNVTVPVGKDVGGSFQNVPACRRPDQTGCVVAYSSFLNSPPTDSLFGQVPGNPSLQVLCTNPANLAGANVLHVLPVVTPGDTRTPITESAGPTLGLHLYDVNIAHGNLVDLVNAQSSAYQHHP